MMSQEFPKISIVTPCYNRVDYIEATIHSILNQNYPNLEYVIIDGGSTDGSVDVIKKYEDKLHYWVSEPDEGMYDAIQKGFDKTSGEIMAWLNSDDLFTPWAFSIVSEIFTEFEDVDWLTSLFTIWWDKKGRAIRQFCRDGFSRDGFMKGEHLPTYGKFSRHHIQQESTFWKRSLWDKAGGHLDTKWKLAGDLELWARFFQHSNLMGVDTSIGGARRHEGQKTFTDMDLYMKEAEKVFNQYGITYYSKLQHKIINYLMYIIPKRLHSVAYKLGLNSYRESIYNMGVSDEWKTRRWK